ncbi:MAG: purine-nucleoside phosphorylase [Bacteroidia bacterium]|nr:purine-nucleoside phosphorylase [Bacteroidia bacterium]
MINYLTKIKDAAAFIRSMYPTKPTVGLILGSGLGALADEIQKPIRIPYQEIPHFPVSTVKGHDGNLVLGELEGKQVIALQGRFHFYEGYTMRQVTFPVRVFQDLGVETMIVTNACGGINPKLYPGALMFITDHINFTGTNPLIGENFEELGPRFPDMSHAYDPELRALGKKVADEQGIEVFEGIYTATAGPYYFSRAELVMVRNFGSDTIGMSTVPEVIVARHSGMRSLGISAVTDMAIPETHTSITHAEVVEVANRTRPKFIKLVRGILNQM